MARAHTREAVEALVAALKRPREAVPAAVALLNRGWGLPKVTVEADPTNPLLMHLLAAEAVSRQIAAERRGRPATIAGIAEPAELAPVDLLNAPPPEE